MNSKSLPLFRGELALCIAVLMNSFGVVLMLYSGAGISAISSVPFAFSEVWPVLTLGTWTYLFQGCLVLSLMLLRKKFVPSFDKSITKFNKFSPDFLCILAQHKQAVKFCFLAASFIRSVLPILSSRPAFPAMRSLSYIMVTLLFVMRSAPVPAGIGGTWSPHSYTRESSGGSC